MRTFINLIIYDTNNKINVDDISNESRLELDSHTNMPVVGQDAYILSNILQTADVNT